MVDPKEVTIKCPRCGSGNTYTLVDGVTHRCRKCGKRWKDEKKGEQDA